MEITFIGSLTQEGEMHEAAKKIRSMYKEVIQIHIPGRLQGMTFEEIVTYWYENIKKSDLVIAFPKEDGRFGEGSTYEISFARLIGKLVLTWNCSLL